MTSNLGGIEFVDIFQNRQNLIDEYKEADDLSILDYENGVSRRWETQRKEKVA